MTTTEINLIGREIAVEEGQKVQKKEEHHTKTREGGEVGEGDIQDQVSSVIKQNLFHQPGDCSIGSSTNLSAEFKRITTVGLLQKFFSELDAQSSKLLKVFSKKGGAQGRKIKSLLMPLTQTDNFDVKRECILKALSVYLNEDPEKVVKERMDSDVDNGQAEIETVFGVFVIRREGAARDDGPEDVGIILEGVQVLSELGNTMLRDTSMVLQYHHRAAPVQEPSPREGGSLEGKQVACGEHPANSSVPKAPKTNPGPNENVSTSAELAQHWLIRRGQQSVIKLEMDGSPSPSTFFRCLSVIGGARGWTGDDLNSLKTHHVWMDVRQQQDGECNGVSREDF
ncbi:hypothetical protein CRENBAI_014470 [Crenichthys baileyi]|uniref:Uncharacterized protein n=1 Tax=Crenichthys baileyi TaxID=28760 RepID=A0AAV9QTA5_9TELE